MLNISSTIQPNTEQCGTMQYHFDILQRSHLGSVITENKIQYKVIKQYIRDLGEGPIYRIIVSDRKQQDTSPMRSIEKELSFLWQSVAVQTDTQGAITRVSNLAEINELWNDYRHTFYKKYKKESFITQMINATDDLLQNEVAFTQNFIASEVATLLFPNI